MHFLFLDESGSIPPRRRIKPPYFIIGGVIIPDTQWMRIANKLQEIKDHFGIHGEVKWRYFYVNPDPSKVPAENTLQHLDEDDRESVRTQIYDLINSYKSVKALSVVTDVAKAYNMCSTKSDIYHFTYKPITERFQYFLQDLTRDSGGRAYGLVVCDHRGPGDDRQLQELHQRLLNSGGSGTSNYINLIEGLFLAPSHWSVGIQLADMVAGAVYRKYVNNDDRFFSQIESSFRSNPKTGSIMGYGLVHNPFWR